MLHLPPLRVCMCVCVCAQRQFVVKHKKTSLPAWLHCLFYSCPSPLSLPLFLMPLRPFDEGKWIVVGVSLAVLRCWLTNGNFLSTTQCCAPVCVRVFECVCVWIVNLLQSGAGNYYISTLRTCTLRHATCYCEGTSTCPLPLSLLLYFPLSSFSVLSTLFKPRVSSFAICLPPKI